MKQGSTIFLKVVLCLMATGALAAMLWLPQIEGRNANSDPISLYFNDPFLAYAYAGTIPFFIALYQAFKLLKYIEQNKAFSSASVLALRNIKYCALAIIGFIVVGEVIIILTKPAGEDSAGVMSLGIFATFASFVIAVFAAVLQKLIQNGLDIKSENDLTV